jgi:hypothetical protein
MKVYICVTKRATIPLAPCIYPVVYCEMISATLILFFVPPKLLASASVIFNAPNEVAKFDIFHENPEIMI